MIAFNKYYNHFNLISTSLVICSLLLLVFKGLNFGIDFKGGTLIELRSTDSKINVSSLRDRFSKMNLGDVSVKKFGNDIDYLIKFENKNNKKNIVEVIKVNLDQSFGNNFTFRRVENVGPKVSAELLKSGVIAISLSLAIMLFYIWIRFEWQFSLGAILALCHDVIATLGVFSLLSLEINLSIIAAVLTIVGYSMNDTVVVYDRIRENLRNHLRSKGIESRPVFNPIHKMPMYHKNSYSFPVADNLSSRGVSLPSWPGMSHDNVIKICNEIKRFIK